MKVNPSVPVLSGLVLMLLSVSGCGMSQDRDSAELTQAREDVADLKSRVQSLEARMQALEAALPEGNRVEPET